MIDTEWSDLRNNQTQIKGTSKEKFWINVSEVKLRNELRYKNLCDFVFSILIVLHSSTNVIQKFSEYNLNRTKIHNRLETESVEGIHTEH